MAEVNVEKRQEERGRGLGRRSQGGELGRWGDWGFPSLWRNPDELFSMSPFTLMRRFTDDLDRMFSGFGALGGREIRAWAPPVEVRERDGDLVVTAELPGLNKDDVKVEIE